MLSLSKLKEHDEIDKKKIESELPYFMTFITLFATSGFGPYVIFQKLREISLLPVSKNVSDRIIKRIDLLGLDPLTAMTKVKEKSSSKDFTEFLGGYVSSIQGGGDVVSYLQSKMNSAFERYSEIEKQSIEKVKSVVEAYMTLQVVVLAVYIIINAMENPATSNLEQTGLSMSALFVIVPPLISVMFLLIASTMTASRLKFTGNWVYPDDATSTTKWITIGYYDITISLDGHTNGINEGAF